MKKLICSIITILLLSGASALCANHIGVPSESEDVMLQAFYWDSYGVTGQATPKYGRTKWIDLQKDTISLCENFDLIWFPPSAFADGGNGKGGVGYTPKQFTNQESDWGTKTALNKLIAALHRGGTKVIADVVINHRGNYTNWCNFWTDNFGTGYGSFTLTQKHICYGDEGFTTTSSSCYGAAASDRGAADSGTNFEGARDLDHTNEYVQNHSKAYTRWLLGVMKYDGFRYDMTRGYHGKYLKMYNEASEPYISVSEFWMDKVADLQTHLRQTDSTTMIFDFPLRTSWNSAFQLGTYSSLDKNKNTNSLRGKGLEKFAVTFIDNHDTFNRSDNQGAEFLGYMSDLTNATKHNRLIQANAYLLMMPGIPCIFWPHWKLYSEEIKPLIALRKQVGIHSESPVTDESSGLFKYQATIQGHRGKVILRLGQNRDTTVPDGYHVALDGGDVSYYTIYLSDDWDAVEDVNGGAEKVKREKFFRDGKLFIRVGENVFDVLGNKIQ